MVDPSIVQEWLAKADEDFEFARINLSEQMPFPAQICFHFQQSCEKYLKAYIIANELGFRKTHDLPLLLTQCATVDPRFVSFAEDCEFLATFYVETRYPVHWPVTFSLDQALKAYQSAKAIRGFVIDRLAEYLPKP
jgi:HEPN domain-containing protein